MDASIDFVRRIIPATETEFLVPSSFTFDPTSLFSGDAGGWWDVSDHTTTWQDSARTTPANTAGQPVGAVDDKSGNGNHWLQATAGSRPILRNSGSLWWLEFDDASSQYMTIGGNIFIAGWPITRVTAVQNVAWLSGKEMWNSGSNGVSVIGTSLYEGNPPTPNVSLYCNGAFNLENSDLTVGANHVVSEIFNGASSSIQVDNITAIAGNCDFNLGLGVCRLATDNGTIFAHLLWYSSIWIRRVLNNTELANCRTFFGNKAGLIL